MGPEAAYRTALLDWLACAAAGREQPAARAAAAIADGGPARVAAAAAAGHVLDFDDTYLPGLAHLSAATAPAALVLAAATGRSADDALRAYAEGYEAMGALARASHPALYERGLHPTAVCGPLGAAAASAALLGLDGERRRSALALALARGAGLQAAFGSDGKALQVGLAAGEGVRCALLAAAGARMPLERAAAGFAAATGGRYAEPGGEPAIARNWIKPWPCCLQTHGTIEAAAQLRAGGAREGELAVRVHPVSLRAASIAEPADGLEAKFSIPYLAALTLVRGEPTRASFEALEPDVLRLARERVRVRADPALLESEAVIELDGREAARVRAARGSPERPLDAAALGRKLRELGGDELAGALDDPARPARELLDAAGV